MTYELHKTVDRDHHYLHERIKGSLSQYTIMLCALALLAVGVGSSLAVDTGAEVPYFIRLRKSIA